VVTQFVLDAMYPCERVPANANELGDAGNRRNKVGIIMSSRSPKMESH